MFRVKFSCMCFILGVIAAVITGSRAETVIILLYLRRKKSRWKKNNNHLNPWQIKSYCISHYPLKLWRIRQRAAAVPPVRAAAQPQNHFPYQSLIWAALLHVRLHLHALNNLHLQPCTNTRLSQAELRATHSRSAAARPRAESAASPLCALELRCCRRMILILILQKTFLVRLVGDKFSLLQRRVWRMCCRCCRRSDACVCGA